MLKGYRRKPKVVLAELGPEGYWRVADGNVYEIMLDEVFRANYEPVLAPATLVEEVHELLASEES